MTNTYTTPSPHVHKNVTVNKIMHQVLIALMPAYFVGLYFFGVGALLVTAVSIVTCVVSEYIIKRFLLKQSGDFYDGSAVITGLVFSMNLPSNIPVWLVVIGALFAIGVVKMAFGGLGNNIFNPALSGRVFLLVSFPVYMTSWPKPVPLNLHYLDAETAATPLSMYKFFGIHNQNLWELFVGNRGGSIGEISALAIILGASYLLYKRIITWHVPVSIIMTVFIIMAIWHWINPVTCSEPALFHILSGGLLLGACFMSTDYATTPMTHRGMIIYGIGIGVLTVCIRTWAIYPEGMSFAILTMNGFTPLINRYIKPERFGERR
jgi:Na+-translocating ferredoxin:NAD+ oxidoreductase subunit D